METQFLRCVFINYFIKDVLIGATPVLLCFILLLNFVAKIKTYLTLMYFWVRTCNKMHTKPFRLPQRHRDFCSIFSLYNTFAVTLYNSIINHGRTSFPKGLFLPHAKGSPTNDPCAIIKGSRCYHNPCYAFISIFKGNVEKYYEMKLMKWELQFLYRLGKHYRYLNYSKSSFLFLELKKSTG